MINITQTSSAYFFYKSVLRKVSFHPDLFKKELNKAISYLPTEEGVRLYRWSLSYVKSHPELFQSLSFSD